MVTAVEFGNPVPLEVLVKTNNAPDHAVFLRLRQTSNTLQPACTDTLSTAIHVVCHQGVRRQRRYYRTDPEGSRQWHADLNTGSKELSHGH